MEKALKLEVQDVIPKTPIGMCCCCCCTVVHVVLIVLFFPATVTQLGQFKYGLVKNKVTGSVDMETTYKPGRYWIGFWKEFIEFPSTLNTIEFSEEAPEEGVAQLGVLRARDKFGKQVFLDVSIQYQLIAEKVGLLYREMTTLYEDVYISELRDALSKVGNVFGVDEVWEDYQKVSQLMLAKCKEVLAIRHANCWDLQVWGVKLVPALEEQLIRTQVRKQAQRTEKAKLEVADVRARTQVILAEYVKNITIVKASGEAQVYNIMNTARATAEAGIIAAQAQALNIIRDTVVPGTNLSAVVAESDKMNATDLVKYQKYMMLDTQKGAHIVYQSDGGAAMAPVNVQATRALQEL